MLTSNTHTTHYTSELELLGRAARGERKAMHEAIQYLSSANHYLREIMLAALHECTDPAVWQGLVRCVGEHCWEEGPPDVRLLDADSARLLDESVQQAFMEDHTLVEREMKLAVLHTCLQDDVECVRHAAACLLGLRGDSHALPALAETLNQGGDIAWQVRAVQALVQINDPRCGLLLVQALSLGNEAVHQAAGQAIRKIAATIRDALIQALEHSDMHVRWHAARTLVEIGDQHGMDVVTDGLLHESHAIRFASAEAMSGLAEQAVPPLLNLLSRPGLTQPTLQAVGHAIHSLESYPVRKRLRPLLMALKDPTTSTAIPAIAQKILAEWDSPAKRVETRFQ